MTKKAVSKLLNTCYRMLGTKETCIFADQLMYLGFREATTSGVSIGINDMVIPAATAELVAKAEGEEHGRATGRERVCTYVKITGVAVSLKKKHKTNNNKR